jgi:predicted nucleic acid-binding protein
LRITGALGIIHKAKQVGVITQVRPLIDKLISTNFRISEKLIIELLRMNTEEI